MAKTAFATGNALTKKVWEEKLFRDTKKESYFNRFMGTSPNAMCQVNTKLNKEAGDRVTFGIIMRLAGSGVGEGETLEGNEEKLVTNSFNLTLTEWAHGVRDRGPMDRKRVTFSIDEESVFALKNRGAEKIDELAFTAIEASPTVYFSMQSGVVTYGTTDPKASVTATDLITPKMISHVKVWAKTGGNRAQTPLRPIMIGGKKHYVLLVHPDVGFDLKNDSTYTQARREALERGNENPLFTGALGVWDNVIVHEHENVGIATDWGGASVAGAKCSFLGAQSLAWAWGKRPEVVAETFDYKREHGYGWDMIYAVGKPKFDSKDYGAIAFYVARTQISDAS
jgi:N4-gp56 family major capsid protein